MVNWEYKIIYPGNGEAKEHPTWEECLNYYGDMGWELVSYNIEYPPQFTYRIRYIFKREKLAYQFSKESIEAFKNL